MIFLKNYFVDTTEKTDCIPIIHDVRFAIRDSQMKEGLVTITLPAGEAGLVLAPETIQEPPADGCRSLSLPFQNGELLLNPKEMIYLIDRAAKPKRREFVVQVMGEKAAAAAPAARGGRRR